MQTNQVFSQQKFPDVQVVFKILGGSWVKANWTLESGKFSLVLLLFNFFVSFGLDSSLVEHPELGMFSFVDKLTPELLMHAIVLGNAAAVKNFLEKCPSEVWGTCLVGL